MPKRNLASKTLCLALTCVATSTSAGPITLADFSVNSVMQNFNSEAGGSHSSPYLIGGDIFSAASGLDLQIGSCTPTASNCLATWNELDFIDIILGGPAIRAGAFITNHLWASTGYFYDENDALLGSVREIPSFIPPVTDTEQYVFVGFETDGNYIHRVRFVDDMQNGFGMAMDNFIVEPPRNAIPEPSSLILIGLGLIALWRKKACYATPANGIN